jgi:hypothetical protein
VASGVARRCESDWTKWGRRKAMRFSRWSHDNILSP